MLKGEMISPQDVKVGMAIRFKPVGAEEEVTSVTTLNAEKWTTKQYNLHTELGTYKVDREVKKLTGKVGQRMVETFWANKMKGDFRFSRQGGSIGFDPEIFLVDKNDKVIPAWKFLGNKKTDGTCYWDGFQAECTTQAGACMSYVFDSMYEGYTRIFNAAKKKFPDVKFSNKTVVEVEPQDLAEATDVQVQFGCQPSLNIYGLVGEKIDGRTFPLRFAGGHIHNSHYPGPLKDPQLTEIVKTLDAVIGVGCVSLFEDIDDPRRRNYYGLPGEYRLPKYGLEYRTLSNAWTLIPWVANMVCDVERIAYEMGNSGLRHLWKVDEDEVVETIRNCDVKQARKILLKNEAAFTKILISANGYAYGRAGGHTELAWEVFTKGLKSIYHEPIDVAYHWAVKKPKMWGYHCDGIGMNWKGAGDLWAANPNSIL